MHWLLDSSIWMALLTLSALEIVLGIDNIIFIAILAGRLPRAQQSKGRLIGLALAMLTRIALLFSLSLIMQLTTPWFTILGEAISGRDLILLLGGLFLLAKSTLEIHHNMETDHPIHPETVTKKAASFFGVVTQIAVLDIVFSLDSVITAIGLATHLPVMIIAIVLAIIVMMAMSGPISAFVERHPTIKILALSFLLLIGVALVAESFELHIPKGYIYFAMAFSTFVEMLNLRLHRKSTPDA